MVLYFIAQAEAKSQIWLIAPIVLHIRFNIKLADGCQGIAGTDAELRRSSASRANLGRRLSLLHQLQRSLIALNTCQPRYTAGKNPLPAKVVGADVANADVTDAPTELDGVHAFLNLREIL